MKPNRPRGSEWRKWDLHIHSPGTKYKDNFRAVKGDIWDDYCELLHGSDVQAFGIADYFSADGYLNTKREFEYRYSNSDKVLFPNIELRTTYVVNKQLEEVHLHLVFNPFQQDYESKIESFLTTLKTNKTDSGGRNVRASELSSKGDLEEATTTREFIRDALEDTYGKEVDLVDHVLIITAANNDGIRAVPGKKRKSLIADELDKFSDAFFGNAGNVDYFLSTNRAEDKSEYTKPKPVLSGCDAHSLKELNERLGQVVSESGKGILLEPTWIKADLTYEGLKQIIFEPENRAFIGDEPEIERRVREHKTRYIESLNITSIEGYQKNQHGSWFDNERIVLGKELVAIIGNKGSGKSAVTDIIGLLGNSHNQTSRSLSSDKAEELFSFLNKNKFLKRKCAGNFKGTLHWYEGQADEEILDAQVVPHLPERVEYLPQKYLERICANIEDDEFRTTLNEVIFRYVKEKDRHERTNLDDLIKYLTCQAEEDIDQKKQDLHEANEIVVSFENKVTDEYRKQLIEKIKLKKDEIAAHKSAEPDKKLDPNADTEAGSKVETQAEKLKKKITSLVTQLELLETEQVTVSQHAVELKQLRQAIQREATSVTNLEQKYHSVLNTVGIDFSKVVSVTVNYSMLDEVIMVKEQRLVEIEGLLITEEHISRAVDADGNALLESAQQEAIAKSLVCQKARFETERKDLIELLGKPAREYQEYQAALEVWMQQEKALQGENDNPDKDSLKWLLAELTRIDSDYRTELKNACEKRDNISKDILKQKCGLTRFYNEVKDSIDREIAKCRDHLGEYDIRIDAGLRFDPIFNDQFFKFIHQGLTGSFHGSDRGRTKLREYIDSVDDWQREVEVFSALSSIVEALHKDKRDDVSPPNASRDVFKQMKGQMSVQELYDYLFSFDYLGPKYDLMVDQKDLSELSPGERGGLLLVFYLMLDRQDTPLVIDQPEDNLDNKSVYEILVTFIKQAKKRRQIILVTHNPNLAVVADAEQIIRVEIDKKDGKNDFDFFSGGIENPRINRAVVDILEGTLPAFDNRRLKYRKQPPR